MSEPDTNDCTCGTSPCRCWLGHERREKPTTPYSDGYAAGIQACIAVVEGVNAPTTAQFLKFGILERLEALRDDES